MADDKSTRATVDQEQDTREPTGEPRPAAETSGEAASESAPEVTPEALSAQLSQALEQAETYKDQALRSQAEAENTRRRAAREVENAHKYALEKFAVELLPVLDSLEKAVELAGSAEGDAAPIAEGVQLSLKLFASVLEKAGIQPIDPLGAPFDPQQHEAMAMVPSEHAEPNSVIEVMQKGYLLNGRLIRAAMVVVAKAPAG